MATLSSILAWRIPCTEEPGRLQSMGLQRVRHNWETNISFRFIGMVIWLGIKFEIATCFLSGLKFLVSFCCWKVNSFVWLIFLCGNLFFPLCFKNICCGSFFSLLVFFFFNILCFFLGVNLIYSAGEWFMLYYLKATHVFHHENILSPLSPYLLPQ